MLYFMCAYYREYDAPHYFWREYYLPFMKNSTNFDFSKPMIVINRYDAGSKKNKYLTNYICQDKIKRGKGQTCRNAGTQS